MRHGNIQQDPDVLQRKGYYWLLELVDAHMLVWIVVLSRYLYPTSLTRCFLSPVTISPLFFTILVNFLVRVTVHLYVHRAPRDSSAHTQKWCNMSNFLSFVGIPGRITHSWCVVCIL